MRLTKEVENYWPSVCGHLQRAAELGIDTLEHGFGVSTDFVTDKKTKVRQRRANQSLAI